MNDGPPMTMGSSAQNTVNNNMSQCIVGWSWRCSQREVSHTGWMMADVSQLDILHPGIYLSDFVAEYNRMPHCAALMLHTRTAQCCMRIATSDIPSTGVCPSAARGYQPLASVRLSPSPPLLSLSLSCSSYVLHNAPRSFGLIKQHDEQLGNLQ